MERAIKSSLCTRSTVYKDLNPALLSSLALVAEQHGLDAKALGVAFDKFMTISRPEVASVGAEDVEAFQRDYVRAPQKAPTNNLFNRNSWDDVGMDDQDTAPPKQPSQRITPYLNKVTTQRPVSAVKQYPTPASTGKFKQRTQSGAVLTVLNEHIHMPDSAKAEDAVQSCDIKVLGHPADATGKYMVNRIEDKAAFLEQRINVVEAEVQSLCGPSMPHPVAMAAQQETYFVGRICCDTEEGRLNPNSVLLEGSMKLSQGNRIRLDLSKCASYRVFPGQVVVVKGTNPSGFCVVASEVLPGLPLPFKCTPVEELVQLAEGRSAQGQSYIIAAGPYTTPEDLDYEPLTALLECCTAHRPDMLLLLGPFVDVDHPLIRGGMLDETFDDVFHSRVAGPLNEYMTETGGRTRVVLMPSTRDVHHDPVFPQPPLEATGDAIHVANPCTFSCNDVVLGCSTADWLMAGTKEEISQSEQRADRLPALASHLIAQRSYFPMFPPPLDTPLDASRAVAIELVCTPDILLVPSDLAPFAKVFASPLAQLETEDGLQAAGSKEGNVVCINPGRLTKGVTGGTFVQVYVQPHKQALDAAAGNPLATNGAVAHGVDSRCRVEIRKI